MERIPIASDDDRVAWSEVWQAARQAWPAIDLDSDVFVAYIAERHPKASDVITTLRTLRTSDLYLACACARGDLRAISAFERCYLSVLDKVLLRISGVNAAIVDDVKQQIRRKLFVADDRPVGIREFSGRGDLRRWVRVMGVHEALSILRRSVRETSDGALIEQAVLPAADPEIEYFKRRYQHQFMIACATALQRIDARDRALLRQSFVDGLTIDEIGALYRVHRATAARWLARAQLGLTKEIRAALIRTLDLQPAELRSVLRLIRSGLQVSLRSLFDGWQPPEPLHGATRA